jgi:hypothetical protein
MREHYCDTRNGKQAEPTLYLLVEMERPSTLLVKLSGNAGGDSGPLSVGVIRDVLDKETGVSALSFESTHMLPSRLLSIQIGRQVPLSSVINYLHACAVSVVEVPVERTLATGEIRSVYIRDPDQNLIKISEYI